MTSEFHGPITPGGSPPLPVKDFRDNLSHSPSVRGGRNRASRSPDSSCRSGSVGSATVGLRSLSPLSLLHLDPSPPPPAPLTPLLPLDDVRGVLIESTLPAPSMQADSAQDRSRRHHHDHPANNAGLRNDLTAVELFACSKSKSAIRPSLISRRISGSAPERERWRFSAVPRRSFSPPRVRAG